MTNKKIGKRKLGYFRKIKMFTECFFIEKLEGKKEIHKKEKQNYREGQ